MAGEADNFLPDTVDVAGAVELIASAPTDEAAALPGSGTSHTSSDEALRLVAEDQPVVGSEAAVVEETASDGAGAVTLAEPPASWPAEGKAAWADVPAALRPLLHEHEQQRIAFFDERTREATEAREQAVKAAQAAGALVEQAAAWWQQNGPAFDRAFVDKWSKVDWKTVAEKDPAEVARLIQQRQEEQSLLEEAEKRGQADIAAARERAEQELVEARRAEHAKLAHRLPEYFGPDRARQTYDELARFLFAKGIPADRIAAIHEAPVIELALAAMRFEKAQLALRSRERVAGGRAPQNPAKSTPTRIAPGPAARLDNRNTDPVRQAGERFRRSGGASIADAAELIRLNDL